MPLLLYSPSIPYRESTRSLKLLYLSLRKREPKRVRFWSQEVAYPPQLPHGLLTGKASGLLGREVQRQFALDGWNAVGTGLSRTSLPEVIKLNILDSNDIHRVLAEVKPHVVVHCAANRFPDSCTADPVAAGKINVDASRALAEATTARGIFLIYISTDYVFSGRPGEAPYKPTSAPNPPNVYVILQFPYLQLYWSAPELPKPNPVKIDRTMIHILLICFDLDTAKPS